MLPDRRLDIIDVIIYPCNKDLERMIQNTDDERIENIIRAFKGFAMDDIKFNKDRPIAAAILAGCLLDQFSSFFFRKGKAADRAREFVKKYLPLYHEIRIYDIIRNPLVHNYALPKWYSVTSDPAVSQEGLSVLPNGIIYIPSFIKDLDAAIDRAVRDLREDKLIQKLALEWEKDHPVLGISEAKVHLYSKEELERLVSGFLPKLLSLPVFSSEPLDCQIIANETPMNKFQAFLEVKQLTGDKAINRYPLELIAEVLGIESPIDFLENCK